VLSCDYLAGHVIRVLLQVLEAAGVATTYIYSSLDQTARKINAAKFVSKKIKILLVTDVAVSRFLLGWVGHMTVA